MSHYAPTGMKHPSLYQEMYHIIKQKVKYVMLQLFQAEKLHQGPTKFVDS